MTEQSLRWAVNDAWVLTWRNLTVWRRVPAYLVFTIVQPTIFTLLFRFVFGGAIPVAIPGGYVNYLLPGVIGQTAAFATMATAISLAIEAQKGVIDRLRVMPIARSAVLLGRLAADGFRMLVTLLVIIAVGYAVGFRFSGGVGAALGMIALAEAFGLALCCVSMFIGLALRQEEAVQAFGLIWLFPLTFVSSAFVPVQSMPGWLQAFAVNQPVTHVINALRALALGDTRVTPMGDNLWLSIVWIAAIVAVFMPLAVRAYKRVS
ncbi:MAG: type transport system permease protein [Frankiaceae bacterium]|jgi:ABC-2 type transport system permease protein/oleandomycin transport system permease protein|nr:type transport system permease protein [Frankiaceae bacterium]